MSDAQSLTFLSHLPERTVSLGLSLLTVLLLFFLSSLLGRFINGLTSQGHLQPVMRRRLQLGRRWLSALIVPLPLLQATGLIEDAWTLVTTILATVAIGFFAVWSMLSNATSALLVVAFRPFRVGDEVDLVEPSNGSVLSGRVDDMNLMFTTLKENRPEGGKSVLHIPNNLFFQKIVRVHGPPEEREQVTPFFAASQGPPIPPALLQKKP